MTLNSKIIVINALSRGGSNLVWNALQSHPKVCSPILETGQIIYPTGSSATNPLGRTVVFLFRQLVNGSVLSPGLSATLFGKSIDHKLYSNKLLNLDSDDNREQEENTPYTREEVSNAVLCTKSLDRDVFLTDFFDHLYPSSFFIGLVRNGYAVCEGWMRRGLSPSLAGRLYARYTQKILDDSERLSNYHLIRFEDFLKDPFSAAKELFSFADLEPNSLEKLRFKSKNVISEGEHKPAYGTENCKYWVDRSSIQDFIRPDISSRQASLLPVEARKSFEVHAMPQLTALGYA